METTFLAAYLCFLNPCTIEHKAEDKMIIPMIRNKIYIYVSSVNHAKEETELHS